MLIYLDDTSGTALLDLLNTEAAFGTLNQSLIKIIKELEEGLKDYGGRSKTQSIL